MQFASFVKPFRATENQVACFWHDFGAIQMCMRQTTFYGYNFYLIEPFGHSLKLWAFRFQLFRQIQLSLMWLACVCVDVVSERYLIRKEKIFVRKIKFKDFSIEIAFQMRWKNPIPMRMTKISTDLSTFFVISCHHFPCLFDFHFKKLTNSTQTVCAAISRSGQ